MTDQEINDQLASLRGHGDEVLKRKLAEWIGKAMSEYQQAAISASNVYKTVLFGKIEVLKNLQDWLKKV